MDKSIVKIFATNARTRMKNHIIDKLNKVGISQEEIKTPLPSSTKDVIFIDIGTVIPEQILGNQIRQRENLISEISSREEKASLKKAFDSIVEEAAYTWFNRIIAIRFMEVNRYLHNEKCENHFIRILSSIEEGRIEPDIIRMPFDAGFNFTTEEIDLIKKYQIENDFNKLFNILFLKQCNELNKSLGFLFEKTNGTNNYMELLFEIPYTEKDGVIRQLIDNIPESYFDLSDGGQVEIIGWLYQEYNSDVKDEVYARAESKKIEKEDIPAVTQLFTPQWIVKYMVENSLGRLWETSHDDSDLVNNWKYYLDEAKQPEYIKDYLLKICSQYKNISPIDIKIIDPSMGSGHVLVYAFDLLIQIYKSVGYKERDAAQKIVNHNLYGLDIDYRVYQLAYFAIIMKLRQYDRRGFTRNITPHIYSITESNTITNEQIFILGDKSFDDSDELDKQLNYLVDLFYDAKEYGSILKIEKYIDYKKLREYIKENKATLQNIGIKRTRETMLTLIDIAETLDNKYHITITNPPYMGSRGMNSKLTKYLKKHYPNSKNDLFAVFMERCISYSKENGYVAMITMHSWMFLKSYEKLRENIVKKDIINMVHLGAHAFDNISGEVVQTASFILRNSFNKMQQGNYIRLVDINGETEKQDIYLEAINKEDSERLFVTATENFRKIPGMPIAYWASKSVLYAFETSTSVGEISDAKVGLQTGSNAKFLRMWHEVKIDDVKFDATTVEDLEGVSEKWFPYNKGGSFRKWYGNYDYLVNWGNNGQEIKNFKDDKGKLRSVVRNPKFYFKPAITWSLITSGDFSMRYRTEGSIHDVAGMSAFFKNDMLNYVLGLMNTKISNHVLKMINPTTNMQIGNFEVFPIIKSDNKKVDSIIKENIKISKTDWDSFETSWDFVKHPMIIQTDSIKSAYEKWRDFTVEQFNQLYKNEEYLNKIFIEIYGLKNELTPDVDPKNITITKIADEKSIIDKENSYSMDRKGAVESFISYAVGCILGRYSLDQDGLAFAGGEWNHDKYKTFSPTEDNIVLMTESYTGEKDITFYFEKFIKIVYGAEMLEENLDYIGKSLYIGRSSDTSRDKIRSYFYADFYKEHIKTYQRTPIYWQFNSGKNGGFRAITYIHRYNKNTLGKVRLNFLHQLQTAYEMQIKNNIRLAKSLSVASESNRCIKENDILIKKLVECKTYDASLGHLALLEIEIDLDDGVAFNHKKMQKDRNGKTFAILSKIK